MLRYFVSIFVISISIACAVFAQELPIKGRYWELTKNETLWRTRYNNCQYAYYVLLGEGVVAHAEYPPNPHHGFLIGIPDTDSNARVTVDDSDRFIWVIAEYNSTEATTLAGVTNYEIGVISKGKRNFKVIRRQRTHLQTIAAEWFKVEYNSQRGRILEEETLVLRSGIVYEVGLRSTAAFFEADRVKLKEVLAGFRFTRASTVECSNE